MLTNLFFVSGQGDQSRSSRRTRPAVSDPPRRSSERIVVRSRSHVASNIGAGVAAAGAAEVAPPVGGWPCCWMRVKRASSSKPCWLRRRAAATGSDLRFRSAASYGEH